MIQANENERQIIDILKKNGFEVTREMVFGHKWIVDLFGEREDTVLLVELKSGAPVSHADIFDLVALRNSQQFRNKNTKCFIINTGKFELGKDSPIMKVAEAGNITIIYGENLSDIIDELNSIIARSLS